MVCVTPLTLEDKWIDSQHFILSRAQIALRNNLSFYKHLFYVIVAWVKDERGEKKDVEHVDAQNNLYEGIIKTNAV